MSKMGFIKYKVHSTEHLHWNYRLTCILNTIANANADVLALQEVDATNLGELIHKVTNLGYSLINFAYKSTKYLYGCAIFIKHNNYDVLNVGKFECTIRNEPNTFGVMAKLRSKQNSNVEFIVGNVHLLFNPARSNLRKQQLTKAIEQLNDFSENGTLPILLGGDFNASLKSSLHNILNVNDFKLCLDGVVGIVGVGGAVAATAVASVDETITKHNIANKAVALDIGHTGMDQVSTYHIHSWKMVDFIYFRPSKIRMAYKNVSQLPLIAHQPIPNDIEGSDHFPVSVIFQFFF